MSEKDFDIFFNLSFRKLSIAGFKKFDGSLIFFKEHICETDINKNELNFDNIEEDEEHKNNREEFFDKNKFGLQSLQFIIDWMKEGKIVLLNPYEYDNLRVKIK